MPVPHIPLPQKHCTLAPMATSQTNISYHPPRVGADLSALFDYSPCRGVQLNAPKNNPVIPTVAEESQNLKLPQNNVLNPRRGEPLCLSASGGFALLFFPLYRPHLLIHPLLPESIISPCRGRPLGLSASGRACPPQADSPSLFSSPRLLSRACRGMSSAVNIYP